MKKTHSTKTQILGKRIRSLRNIKGWSQQELGERANINYKFLGEIERGHKNPSFKVLVKIAQALEMELPEIFRFEHKILDRKEIETQICQIIKVMPEEKLQQFLVLLRILYPVQ